MMRSPVQTGQPGPADVSRVGSPAAVPSPGAAPVPGGDLRAVGGRAALIGIIVLGACLRLYGLSEPSLWFDESYSYHMTRLSAAGIIRHTAGDVHPPLYYLLLKGWVSVFGDTVFAMRSMSVVLDLVFLAVFHHLAVSLYRGHPGSSAGAPGAGRGTAGSTSIALIATALAATSVFRVLLAREVRMYPLGALLAASSSWALWAALWGCQSSAAPWLAYVVLATGLAYTHNYGLFTVATQWAFALAFLAHQGFRDRASGSTGRRLLRAVLAFSAVGLAYAPWIPVLLRQRDNVITSYWIRPLGLDTAMGAVQQMFVGDMMVLGPLEVDATASVLAAAVLLAGLFRARAAEVYIVLLAVAPFTLGLGVSWLQGRNVLIGKYLFFGFPFFLLALARLIDRIPARPVAVAAGLLLVVNFVGQDVMTWRRADVAHRPGTLAMAAVIAEGFRPGDLILALEPGAHLATSYYLRHSAARVRYLPDTDRLQPRAGQPPPPWRTDDLWASQLPGLPAARVWVITYTPRDVKFNKLPARWQRVEDHQVGDAAPYSGLGSYLRLYRTQ